MNSPFHSNTYRLDQQQPPMTPEKLDQLFTSPSAPLSSFFAIIEYEQEEYQFTFVPDGNYDATNSMKDTNSIKYRITTDGIIDRISSDKKEAFLKKILNDGKPVVIKMYGFGAQNFILPDYSEPSCTKIGGLYRFGPVDDPEAAAGEAAAAAKEAGNYGGKSVRRRSRKRYSSRRRVSNKKYSASRRGRGRGRGRKN